MPIDLSFLASGVLSPSSLEIGYVMTCGGLAMRIEGRRTPSGLSSYGKPQSSFSCRFSYRSLIKPFRQHLLCCESPGSCRRLPPRQRCQLSRHAAPPVRSWYPASTGCSPARYLCFHLDTLGIRKTSQQAEQTLVDL